MATDIKPLTLEEFGDHELIVPIGSRFMDLNNEQYTIPKIQVGVKAHREISRLDGHKIFMGKNGLEEIAFEQKEHLAAPVILKSKHQQKSISDWDIFEFDNEDESNEIIQYEPMNHEDANRMEGETKHGIGIQESKGISKEIIENAKKEAQSILEAANEQAKSIKDAAFQEGYQTGFGQVNSEIETLRTIQKSMLQTHEDVIRGSETQIVELVKLITEKLFSSGLALDPNILKDVVARAINEASRLGNLKVYLNPEDLDKLRKLWREAELDYNGQKIQLASNNEILPGGCFIDGDYGSVDARINTQVKSVVDTLNEIQLDQILEE
jgi:flagellar biosynthesis/type III secretory pathway protein FliH